MGSSLEQRVSLACSEVELLLTYPIPRRTWTEDAKWRASVTPTQSVVDGREHHATAEPNERVAVIEVTNHCVDPDRNRSSDPEVVDDLFAGPRTVKDVIGERELLSNLFAVHWWTAPSSKPIVAQ